METKNQETNKVINETLNHLKKETKEIKTNPRTTIGAVLNQVLFLLEGEDRPTPDNFKIHPLITEESLNKRKQEGRQFKLDPIASPIHNLENNILSVEQSNHQQISQIAQTTYEKLQTIEGLSPQEIQNLVLDQAIKNEPALL